MTSRFQLVIAAMLAMIATACGGPRNEATDVIDAQFTQMQAAREVAEQYRELHQSELGDRGCGPYMMRHQLTAKGQSLDLVEWSRLNGEHGRARDACVEAWNTAMAVYNNGLTLIRETEPGPFEQMRTNMIEGLEKVSEDAVAQTLANEGDPQARFLELLKMTAAENPYNVVLMILSEAVAASTSVGTSLEDNRALVTDVVERIDGLKAKYSDIMRGYE